MTEIEFRSEPTVDLVDVMGGDHSIVSAARVSTLGEAVEDFWTADLEGKDKGLINFLMRDRHGTPFEHNSLTFRISAPMFVFYEFHRHRAGWSYNEESARYRELEPVFYLPGADRPLRQTGKPGAYTFEPGSELQQEQSRGYHKHVSRVAWDFYQGLLENGIAREVARNVLPVSIYKTMYATCNLRSLFSFLSLRWAHPLSQVPTFPLYEIEDVAKRMDNLARQHFPVAFETFDKNGRISP